jgi:death-on-curing protein
LPDVPGHQRSTLNAQRTSAPEDERFDMVIGAATSTLPDPNEIAEQLRNWSYQEG